MQLTNGQEQAIKVCVERYKNKEPYTVVAGPSGSGKSSMLPYLIEALNVNIDKAAFVALTAKAGVVLRSKGLGNVMTLHKMLYIPIKINGTDNVEFKPRTKLEDKWDLIVCDESSMISEEIFNLLLSHKIHCIFIGDNAQLGPIGTEFNIMSKPHVMLDEITRQAQDSGIIRLSMDIRNGKPLEYCKTPDVTIMPKEKISKNLLLGADITICSTNKTRMMLNDQIRKLKWGDKYQETPINGDTLIACRNYWKVSDITGEEPLLNGIRGEIQSVALKETKLLHPKISAKFITDTGFTYDKRKINIDASYLLTNQPTVNSNNYQLFKGVQKPMLFQYGYACTCYKMQGDEADKVLVYNEGFYNTDSWRRFAYTAVTRAKQKVIIVV